jgi:ribosomal protein S18 acetylase RimI-like enzyme
LTDVFAALDATWPAAATHEAGPWRVREGRGGGKRVSAAMTSDNDADIAIAEATQTSLGQPPLFCLREGQEQLDQALVRRGYRVIDPTVIYAAPAALLASEEPRRMTTFPIWPPLAIMTDIWAEGGIGAARMAVMERATGPKTAILGRTGDRAAGAVYVALHGNTAMIHALHVAPDQRRQGLARNLTRAAACWAALQGAGQIALAVTSANAPARGLYKSLGMRLVAQYHYRAR